MTWTAILPVKSLATAKSRLLGRERERREFALAFALDTIQACRNSASISDVVVVSDDESIPAAHPGVRHVRDPGSGLNAALLAGFENVNQPRNVLALLTDLPALRSHDVDLLVELATEHARSFVPDAAGTGSTALVALGDVDLRPAFGSRSRARHRTNGAFEIDHPDLFRMRRDVDTKCDLLDAIRLGVGPHTQDALRQPTS